ncbi:MAG TPA: sensor histidine kinase [Candidatus Hydrogenedentes bacterium]|nr:sensor histidine kinase [Candidatus Hydrogenedentota bacterium]
MNSQKRSPAKHGDLSRRVLAWMLLLSVVPLLIMGSQGYHCGKQAIIEKTNEQLLSVASARRTLVDSWLDQRNSEVDIISSSPSVARCCAHFAELTEEEIDAEVTMMLRSILNRVDAYEDLTVIGPGGNLIARVSRSSDESPGVIPNEIASFANELRIGPKTREQGPLLRKSGDVAYRLGRAFGGTPDNDSLINPSVVVATLNLTRGLDPVMQSGIGEASARSGLGETGKVYLVGTDTQAITEPLPNREPVALRVAFPMKVGNMNSQATGSAQEYRDYLGRVVWGVKAPLQNVPWAVVAEQDKAEALAWLYTLIRRMTITGILTIAALVFVARWTSQRLGEPLRVLARVAQQVRGGATEERVGPLRGVEAEEVRAAFNHMLDDLRDKQRELVRTATLASIGELSSSIVHEMRNPLSSIKMNLQALKRDVDPDPANRELATIADAQVRRLERMLDDLLQYGRPLELKPEPVPFSELMRSVSAVVHEQALMKRVKLEVCDELSSTPLLVDSEQICRALTNVVVNAIQASPVDSTVTVRAQQDTTATSAVRIEVLDEGAGLTAEALERAFSPFYTTKDGGTGLGLANVKKIVELHTGTVTIENRPERGARFSMRLPACEGIEGS